MESKGRKRPRSDDGERTSEEQERARQEEVLSRKCGFCNLGHKEGLEAATDFIDIPNKTTVWASDEPTLTVHKKPVWCHTNCVHFSPQTVYDETATKCKWRGVNKEVLPDGRKNWYPCQEAGMPYFCLKHSTERAEHEHDKEIARLSDLAQGKEAWPVPLEMGFARAKMSTTHFHSALAAPGTANGKEAAAAAATAAEKDQASDRDQWQRLLPSVPLPRGIMTRPRDIDFTYVAATVDSKSAQVRQGPEREKRCCTCTGPAACRDPRKCECLRQGRQYSSKGRLLDEDHPAQIYECNLNCACHADDCRNRLVQRGITCNIKVEEMKVLYLGLTKCRVLEGCGRWGVRAVEEIPARSFVCTVAGQLVLAGDLAGGVGDQGQHSSVLVHRVRDWTERDQGQTHYSSSGGGGSGGGSRRGDGGGSSSRVHPHPPLAGGLQERFVDQRRYANISRYIRCAKRPEDVNLVRVAVHTVNQDPDAPVLALFAARTIEEGTELLRDR